MTTEAQQTLEVYEDFVDTIEFLLTEERYEDC